VQTTHQEFIESIFAKNKALYGGYFMELEEGAENDEQSQEESIEEESTEEVEESTEEESSEEEPEEKAGDLPDWAREKLTKANTEAANYRTKLREAEKKLENVKTLEEVDALIADLKAEREKESAEEAKEKHALLVENIALKYKLPEKLAKRLVGNTREELEADAKELAADYAQEAREIRLEGGLNPRGRGDGDNADPRTLAKQHGSRR
jgi:hypothetical protein